MRTLLLALFILLFCAAPVPAQWQPMPAPPPMPRSGSTDRGTQSGNSSDLSRDSEDSTTAHESDSGTDSESSSTTQSNLPQRTVDSEGNVWSYNPRTRMYWSSNGKVCATPRSCY